MDFPGEPEYEVQNIPTQIGVLSLKILTVEFKEMAYMFMWIENHPVMVQKLMDPKEFLSNAMTGSAMSVSGHVTENKFINIQGYTGIDYKVAFMAGQALLQSRVVIVDGDLVQIMTNGLAGDMIKKENNRFFDSFKVKK